MAESEGDRSKKRLAGESVDSGRRRRSGRALRRSRRTPTTTRQRDASFPGGRSWTRSAELSTESTSRRSRPRTPGRVRPRPPKPCDHRGEPDRRAEDGLESRGHLPGGQPMRREEEDLALFGDRREWVGRLWMRTSASLPFSPRPAGRTRGAHRRGRWSGPSDLGRVRLRPARPGPRRERSPVGREGGATHRPGSAGRSRLRSTVRLPGRLILEDAPIGVPSSPATTAGSSVLQPGRDAAPTGGWRVQEFRGYLRNGVPRSRTGQVLRTSATNLFPLHTYLPAIDP